MIRKHSLWFALIILAVLANLAPARAQGGPATLVRDFNSAPYRPAFTTEPPGSDAFGPHSLVVGGTYFFIGADDVNGRELWASDGTPDGTHVVKDITPGSASSNIGSMMAFGSRLFFLAYDDGYQSPRPWISDGTAAGTFILRNILSGSAVVAGAQLFFFGGDGAQAGLWVSDGTSAGTRLAKDLRALGISTLGSVWMSTAAAGALFFATTGAAAGYTLWKSDGTAAGTIQVHSGLEIGSLAAAGGRLFFWDSRGLWVSDGTASGTTLLKAGARGEGWAADLGGALLFFDSIDERIWRSDGSAAGTAGLKQLPGASSFSPTIAGGKLFFLNTDGSSAGQLWVSDGSAAGTRQLTQLADGVDVSNLTVLSSRIVFFTYDRFTNASVALWASDGTPAGTVQIKQLGPSPSGPPRVEAAAVGGRLLFDLIFISGTDTSQLWASDGTEAGTQVLRNGGLASFFGLSAGPQAAFVLICGGSCSLLGLDGTPAGITTLKGAASFEQAPLPTAPHSINGRAIFYGGDPSSPAIWTSDGTPGGTAQLLERGDALSVNNDSYARLGNRLLFVAGTSIGGQALWASDGAPAGTSKLLSWPGSEFLSSAVSARGGLYFFQRYATNGAPSTIWRSDGTAAGTIQIAQLADGSHTWLTAFGDRAAFFDTSPPQLRMSDETTIALEGFPASLTVAGGHLFFTTSLGQGAAFWVSDGTPGGTRRLRDFDNVAYTRHYPLGDRVLFLAQSGGDWGLWASDDTPEGTARLTAVPQMNQFNPTSGFVRAGGRAFFSLDDGIHGTELWETDGTVDGTGLLKDIWPGAGGANPQQLTALDGQLAFTASDPAHGSELWLSDGTAAGTRLAADISPGAEGSAPDQLTAVNGQLFFVASDPAHGRELWLSDSQGTRLAADVAPGPTNSNPTSLAVAGARLLFSANDGVSGPALWSLPLESQPYQARTLGVSTPIEAEDYDRGGEGLAYHDADPFNHRDVYRPDEAVDTDANGAGNYLLGWAQPGEWVSYSFDVAAARAYRLRLAVASQGAGGSFHLTLDGQAIGGALTVPDTGGWASWRALDGPTLSLTPGRHTLRLGFDTAGASGFIGNFDRLVLDGSSENLMMPSVTR